MTTPRNPFVGQETFQRKVRDQDGHEWTVTFRRLSAGDEAAITDKIRMLQSGENDEDIIQPMIGTTKLLTVQRAVIGWDLPAPYEPHMVEMLDRDLFAQMFEHVEFSSDTTEIPAPVEAAAPDPLPESSESSTEQKPKLVASKS
jgi:hypothetical protein